MTVKQPTEAFNLSPYQTLMVIAVLTIYSRAVHWVVVHGNDPGMLGSLGRLVC